MNKGGRRLPWETEETKEFDDWFDVLDEDDKIQVIAAKDLPCGAWAGCQNARLIPDQAAQRLWNEGAAPRLKRPERVARPLCV